MLLLTQITSISASVAALTTSTVNIALLTVMHGKQLGWVCLSSCGTDVSTSSTSLYFPFTHDSAGRNQRDGSLLGHHRC